MAKSEELKQFGREFLLTFTAELIRQHGGADFYKLKQILKQELSPKSKLQEHKKKGKTKEETEGEEYKKSVIPKEKKKKEDVKKLLTEKKKESSPEEIKKRLSESREKRTTKRMPVLRVPETRLPKQFQYLRPQAKERDIELEKLKDLANDPNVREMECKGPDQNIHVRGGMGYQPTQITLSENEISDLLSRFSNKSQIPIMAGNYHVAVGDLTLTAQVKEDRGKSTFVIKKIPPSQPQGTRGPIPQGAQPQVPPPQPQQQTGQASPQQGQQPSAPLPPQPPQKKEKSEKPEEQEQIHDKDKGDFSGYQKSET